MLLQSLLRPVLTPLMRGMFDAPIFSSSAWSPLALWPDGIDTPGMWISPRDLTSQWQDYTGTTPVATPGTVADASNPVGLALDIRAGATVLTDPGLHMLQSTSVDRPLLSARVNLLTYTEDFSNAVWVKQSPAVTVATNTTVAPDGTTTADTITWTGEASLYYPITLAYPVQYATSTYIKGTAGETIGFWADLGGASDRNTITLTGEWQRLTTYGTAVGIATSTPAIRKDAAAGHTASVVNLWGFQLNFGPTVLPYQPILTDGSSYASGPPIAQLYNGTNSGMATAAFAAGTLIDGVDCMIAVRRDSSASCVAGLYNGVADATKFFGMAESASGSGCVGSGAGTPTVWVDNTQLTGGTAVTRGTLHTALTVGDWHILEFRNLDLSTWTAAGFGLYTSYLFPGPRGDILLYPSTTPTTDKDAARQWLADYYGVTLP